MERLKGILILLVVIIGCYASFKTLVKYTEYKVKRELLTSDIKERGRGCIK